MTITEHIVNLQAIAARNPNLVICEEWVSYPSENRRITPLHGNYEIGHVRRNGSFDDDVIPCEPENASALLIK